MTEDELEATPVPDKVFISLLMFTHRYRPHNRTIAGDHHNILFLSEGFTVEERSVFDSITLETAKQFLKIAPFNLHIDEETSIRNKFMFYSAFIPSPVSGISIEPEVKCDLFDYAIPVCKPTDDTFKLKYKDSALGLIYDFRKERLTIRSKKKDTDLIPQIINRIFWDIDSSNPYVDPDIPGCWLEGGRDYGLVCILVNDDVSGGVSYTDKGYVICTIKHSSLFRLTPDKTDHFPRSNKYLDYVEIASIMAHEFGHSYFELGDEYVDVKNYEPNPERAIKYKNILLRENIPWFSGTESNEKWLPILTSSEVRIYMRNNNKPLSVTKDVMNGTKAQFPDKEFWDQNPGLSSNSPWEIIGLYEGAYYSFKNIYRPAGLCLMRNRKSCTAVSVTQVPPIIDWKKLSDIDYRPEEKLIYCYGKMLESVKDNLITLAGNEYEEFRNAVEQLYRLTHSEEANIINRRGFCFVCKSYIFDKLEQDPEKHSKLREVLNKEYPVFSYSKKDHQD